MSLLSARNIVMLGSLVGVSMLLRHKLKTNSRRTAESDGPIAVDEMEREIAEIRSAGPRAMRDRPRRRWDRVDQAIDESFPASDPAGYY